MHIFNVQIHITMTINSCEQMDGKHRFKIFSWRMGRRKLSVLLNVHVICNFFLNSRLYNLKWNVITRHLILRSNKTDFKMNSYIFDLISGGNGHSDNNQLYFVCRYNSYICRLLFTVLVIPHKETSPSNTGFLWLSDLANFFLHSSHVSPPFRTRDAYIHVLRISS